LVDMENAVVAQERDLLDFACLFVLLLNELPEDNHAGFLALLDLATFLLALLEGDILASLAKHHLIEKAIRFARGAADTGGGGDPRLLPRDDAIFHLVDNAVSDFLVDIHMLCSFVAGSKAL